MVGFINETLKDGTRHTIDKERKIILKETYWGAGEPYARFSLKIKNKEINFEADYGTKPNKAEKKNTIYWNVYKIEDHKFKKSREEAMSIISDALSSHGLTGNLKTVDNVIVSFHPSLNQE